jgi:hypothetical protein
MRQQANGCIGLGIVASDINPGDAINDISGGEYGGG